MTNKKDSIEDLIKAIFYEAAKRTGNPNSKNAMANHISKWLLDNRGFYLSAKTLIRHYERYVLKTEDAQANAAPNAEHQHEYAIYLGYANYNDFVIDTNDHSGSERTGSAKSPMEMAIGTAIQHQTNVENQTNIGEQTNIGNQTINNHEETKESKNRSKLILMIVIFIALVTSITLWYLNSKNSEKLCLFWKNDHFESAECKNASEDEKELMISPDEWRETYKDFRKIQPTTTTRFFNSNGKAVVWYQYRNGKYEFFNQSGSHPLNGKKLIPVDGDVVESYLKSIEEPTQPVTTSEFEQQPYVIPETIENSPADIPSKEIEKSEVTKGKYCFKNESNKALTAYIKSTDKPNQRVDLQPNEQVCVLLPLNNYSYQAFVSGQSTAIKQGKFTVSENIEGLLSLYIPKEEVTTTEPEKTTETKPAKDCSKGDFCITNTTQQKLDVRIGNKTDGPLGSNYYFYLTIQPGRTECFYDVPATAYYVKYYFNDQMQNEQSTQLKVVGCETGNRSF